MPAHVELELHLVPQMSNAKGGLQHRTPRKLWSRSRSRSSGSVANASTASWRSTMSSRTTSGCFSHTCEPDLVPRQCVVSMQKPCIAVK